jgi:AcrR family transcriptional regulator
MTTTGKRRPRRQQARSAETRQLILDRALALFRKRGFERTTMRQIAADADLSLGAAYYYFPSKEAIVLAYYQRHQDEHAERFHRAVERAGAAPGVAQVRLLLDSKLELLRRDRRLLTALFGALFQSVGQPGAPLSVFSPDTAAVRRAAIDLCREALGGDDEILALSLWLAHLGLVLYFVHDRSPRQERTRRLLDGAVPLLAPLLLAARSPLAGPLRQSLITLLADAGLLAQSSPTPAPTTST